MKWFAPALPCLVLATACAPASASAPTSAIAPGRYCSHGTPAVGSDPASGPVDLVVEVTRDGARTRIGFHGDDRSDGAHLVAWQERAKPQADGSLRFRFTDFWRNEGEGEFHPSGRFSVRMTKPNRDLDSHEELRLYGGYQVTRAACTAADLDAYMERPPFPSKPEG